MHSVLAYRSSEVETLRRIMITPSEWTDTSISRLPLELLLLIEDFLIPMITRDHITRTISSIRLYEDSVRELLCPECTIYNFEIYGPDIWQWEQVTGACACQKGPMEQDSDGFTSPRPSPQRFSTVLHWLEAHLSHNASFLTKTRGLDTSPGLADSEDVRPDVPSENIWEIVTAVLHDLGCEVGSADSVSLLPRHAPTFYDSRVAATGGSCATAPVIQSSPLLKGYNPSTGRGLSELSNDDLISIFPLRRSIFRIPSPPDSPAAILPADAMTADGGSESFWRNRAVLNRMGQRLGLYWEYPEIFSTSHLQAVSETTLAQQRRYQQSQRERFDSLPFFSLTRATLRSLSMSPCLSAPVAFPTFILSLVCFYSIPHVFNRL